VTLPYWKFDEPAPNLFTKAFMGIPNASGALQFDPGNPLQFWTTDNFTGILRRNRFNTATSPANVMGEAETLALAEPAQLFESFTDMEGDPHGAAHTSFRDFI